MEKEKIKEWLIFIFGKNRKTRFIRILITVSLAVFFLIMMFGVSADLGPIKIKPVADIKINK